MSKSQSSAGPVTFNCDFLHMQPRFTPPVGVPPSGFPPNAMPMPPRPGFPGGFPPMFAPPGGAPPPPHMMPQHGMPMGMIPGMNMGMGSGPPMPMHAPGGGPPPQMFNSMPGGPGFGNMQPPPQSYPPKPAPSVIVGAPVLRAGTVAASAPPAPAGGPPVPTQPAPIVVVSAASAMHDFNFSNPSAVFMNATSNLLNKIIFLNSAAALPLTLFIGQVPMDMTDAVVTKILEIIHIRKSTYMHCLFEIVKSCGKIFKLVRPVDPATQLPASFVLVTYSQGICAARCANILNNYLIDPVECTAFVVKTGKKDGAALESIIQSEKEAGEQLPEGYSLQNDIYTPIRVTIDNILVTANPPPPPSVPPPAEVVAAAAAEHSSKSNIVIPQGAIVLPTITLAMVNSRNEAIEAGEIVEEEETPVSGAAGAGRDSIATGMVVNYYNHLDVVDNAVNNTMGGGSTLLGTTSVAEQLAVDEAGEKMLTGEIQKFRQRQLQRDKDVEEERKLKIKQKMQELREMQKIRAEREARVLAEGPPLPPTAPPAANNSNNFRANAAAADAVLDSTAGTKRRMDTVEESAEVLEAKRRRKLQVLEMLAGDSGLLEQVLTATETPSSAADADTQQDSTQQLTTSVGAAAEAAGFAPINTSAAAGASAAVKKLVTMRSKAAVANKASFAAADEEDTAPKREMVLLDYSADELRELAHTAQHYNISHAHDEGSLEDDLAAYRKKGALGAFGAPGAGAAGANMTAAGGIDISSIQARVLAQAQAISAALAQKTQAAAPAATTAAFAAGASGASSGVSGSASGAAQKGAAVVDEKARLKSLVDKIPTDKDELFAYPVNWAVLDKHDILNEVMTAWITKKIVEYLGEEEEQLRDFIVNKLRARCRPVELLEELGMVLDEDAALPFVLKLWRMLVYYSVKNQ